MNPQQKEKPKILNEGNQMLHHLEIYVSDLKKSFEFWSWFLTELGYEPYQKWDKGFSWKYGDTYLVFVQTEDRFLDVPYHRCRVGLNHLAFHGKSREQVDEITEKLKESGIHILYMDKHPHAGGEQYYAVFFEDPDRIKVEIVAPDRG
jgi:catechol 2,3-dioxygenase-like lactoylglutathione lyase family enzyme